MARRVAARQILPPGQIFCPVGRALDVIGDRWTLVLVRHLLGGALGFQELRARTGIAPRVLSMRLRTLAKRGFIALAEAEGRPRYQLNERGRALEPIITATARWYLRHGLDHLDVDPTGFSATSARSILESLPFLLREDRAAGVDLTFEIRLSGLGGGVEARVWCAVALGIAAAKDVYCDGLMTKDGGREALDYYFYQIARTPTAKNAPQRAPRRQRTPPRPLRSLR
jgi:DNA-binding HxlR family transcriptional regulator